MNEREFADVKAQAALKQLPLKEQGLLGLYYDTPGLEKFDRTSKIRALAKVLQIRWSKNPERLLRQWLCRARRNLMRKIEESSIKE